MRIVRASCTRLNDRVKRARRKLAGRARVFSTRTAPVTLPGCTYKTGRGLIFRVIFHRIPVNDTRFILPTIAISHCIPRRLRVFIVFNSNDRRVLSSTRASTAAICSFSRLHTTIRQTTIIALGFCQKHYLFSVALPYTLIDSSSLSHFSVFFV